MPKEKFIVSGYKCILCGHIWKPHYEEKPLVCPKCKSPRWDIGRRKKNEK